MSVQVTDVGLRMKKESRIIPRFGSQFLCELHCFSTKNGTQKDKGIRENSMYDSGHFKSSNQGDMIGVWAPILAKFVDENVGERLSRREDQ